MWPTVLVPTGPRRPPPGPRQAHGASGDWGRRGGERAEGCGAAGRGRQPHGGGGARDVLKPCALCSRELAVPGEALLVPPPAPAPARAAPRYPWLDAGQWPAAGPPRTDARGWEPPTDERGPAAAAWVGGAGAHPAGSGLMVLWCLVVLGKSRPQRVCSKMLSGSSSRWVQRPSFCGTPASRWPVRAGTEGVPAGPRDLTDCRAPLLLSVELFFGWDLLRTSPPSGQEMEAAFGSRPPLRGHFLLCFGGGLGVVVEPLGLSPPPPLTCGSSCFAGAAGCVATLLHDAAMNPAEGNDEPALPGV